MKLYAFNIEESIGEYEFGTYMTVHAKSLRNAEKMIHEIMMTWRGSKECTEYDEETEYYTYFGGDVCARVTDIYETTEEEWKKHQFYLSNCDDYACLSKDNMHGQI